MTTGGGDLERPLGRLLAVHLGEIRLPAIGLALAIGVERFLTSLVYDIGTLDPVVFGLVPLAILLTAFLAYALPARSMTRIEPNTVLRPT